MFFMKRILYNLSRDTAPRTLTFNATATVSLLRMVIRGMEHEMGSFFLITLYFRLQLKHEILKT